MSIPPVVLVWILPVGSITIIIRCIGVCSLTVCVGVSNSSGNTVNKPRLTWDLCKPSNFKIWWWKIAHWIILLQISQITIWLCLKFDEKSLLSQAFSFAPLIGLFTKLYSEFHYETKPHIPVSWQKILFEAFNHRRQGWIILSSLYEYALIDNTVSACWVCTGVERQLNNLTW